LFLEAFEQFEQRHADRLTNLAKLNEVKPSLAGFVFRHKRLRLIQACSKVVLPQPGPFAQLPQHALQRLLLGGKNALIHATRKHN
jgi:hypothetical protein